MDRFYKTVGYTLGAVIGISVLIALSSIMYHLEFIYMMGSKWFFGVIGIGFVISMTAYINVYTKIERKIKKIYLKLKLFF